MPKKKTAAQLDREIEEALGTPRTFIASIRLSGAPTAMQTREFKHRADAERWLDQQREIAERRGWGGYTFELTPQHTKKR